MKFGLDLGAIISLIIKFRDSPDWLITFQELSSGEQAYVSVILGLVAYGLRKLWNRFRQGK